MRWATQGDCLLDSPERGADDGVRSATPKLLNLLEIMNIFDLPRLTMLLYKSQLLEETYGERTIAGSGNQRLTDTEWGMVINFVTDVEKYGSEVSGFQDTEASAGLLRLRIAKNFAVFDSSVVGTEIKKSECKSDARGVQT